MTSVVYSTLAHHRIRPMRPAGRHITKLSGNLY